MRALLVVRALGALLFTLAACATPGSVERPAGEHGPYDWSDVRELAGRVVLPDGVPSDDDTQVVLLALGAGERRFALNDYERWDELDRAPVDADGRYRLMLPGGVKRARVEVRGRYTYGGQSVGLRAEPRVLGFSAHLGAALSVRLVPDPSSTLEASDLAGCKLTLYPDTESLLEVFSPRTGNFSAGQVTLDGRLEGELLRIVTDAEGRYELYSNLYGGSLEPFAGVWIDGVALVPGRTTAVEVPLVDGLAFSGVVLGESGDPIAGASIWTSVAGEGSSVGASWTFDRAGADGRFELRGVDPRFAWIDIERGETLDVRLTRDEVFARVEEGVGAEDPGELVLVLPNP